MLFKDLASYLEKLEKTASRNEMTVLLAQLFQKAEIEEIDKVCYLSLGRLLPKFAGLEFQMAEKMVIQALSQSYGAEVSLIEGVFKKVGDLGGVIRHLEKSQIPNSKRKNLSVNEVYGRLMEIAQEAGEGSVGRKIKALANLLASLDSLSAKYVVRIPLGKLRLGFSEMTILDALSWMGRGDKSLRGSLERAFNVSADIGLIAKEFRRGGLLALKKIRVRPGIPIRPQQAERLPSAEKIMEKLGRCAVEYKLDGLRGQLHIWRREATRGPSLSKDSIEVRIFSRNLENTTHMFPEIVAGARALIENCKLKIENLILDGEAIGVDPKTGKFLPFQETTKRKRKHGISKIAKKIPLKYFAFDCLYFNGEELLSKPFWQRRKILEEVMKGF